MNFKTRPELGTKVTIHRKLKRKIEYIYGKPSEAKWETKEIPPTTGYYAGFRVKQNGEIRGENYDDYSYFHITSTITCAMILLNERANPIHVPFDGIEIAPRTNK